ncbi:MAG TPA: hypothetical protein ENO24_09750, partial [Chloroflexi bacterium]|nr:hypothetical protein [Chloroflexota bacterium]
LIDCGETVELYVTLRNQGADTATGVQAVDEPVPIATALT